MVPQEIKESSVDLVEKPVPAAALKSGEVTLTVDTPKRHVAGRKIVELRLLAWRQRDHLWRDEIYRLKRRSAREVAKERPWRRPLTGLLQTTGAVLALISLVMIGIHTVAWFFGGPLNIVVWVVVAVVGVVIFGLGLALRLRGKRLDAQLMAGLLGMSVEDFAALDWAEPGARADQQDAERLVADPSANVALPQPCLPMKVRNPESFPEGNLRDLVAEWDSFTRK